MLLTLRESSGGPWNNVPIEMFKVYGAGALSWGTLCGAINTSLAVICAASEKYDAIGNELIGWYTEFPFPSEKMDALSHFPKQHTTIAKSPLCHVSVSTWANAVKPPEKINDKAKKDRCAKVTGDTAAKAAELLNQALEGKIVTVYKAPEEIKHCLQCHQGANSTLDNQQGKMNCLSCHDDHPVKLP